MHTQLKSLTSKVFPDGSEMKTVLGPDTDVDFHLCYHKTALNFYSFPLPTTFPIGAQFLNRFLRLYLTEFSRNSNLLTVLFLFYLSNTHFDRLYLSRMLL